MKRAGFENVREELTKMMALLKTTNNDAKDLDI